MIHGLLVILKIIGILLLALLLLCLTVLLLVLLVPVRYRLKASVLEKQPDVELRVTWLLRLIYVSAAYHPGQTPYRLTIRLFGFRLGGRKKKNDGPASGEDGRETVSETGREAQMQGDEDVSAPELLETGVPGDSGTAPDAERTETAGETAPDEWQDMQDLPDGETEEQTGASAWEPYEKEMDETDEMDGTAWEAADTGNGNKPSLAERIRQAAEKIRAGFARIPVTVQRVQDSVEKLAEKKDRLITFLEDADNQTMFRLLKRQAGGVIGHVLPRKFRLYLHFGFPDPCLTGQILGYVSIFYAYYCQTVELVPEFQTDTLILEGDLYAKGRIRAAALLCRGIRLLFNKGCRRMIRTVLKR